MAKIRKWRRGREKRKVKRKGRRSGRPHPIFWAAVRALLEWLRYLGEGY